MADVSRTPVASDAAARKRRPPGRMKSFWRAIREPLANSRLAKAALVSLLANALKFINWTNRRIDKTDYAAVREKYTPGIIALWHGQHLLAPCTLPRDLPLVAMVSRSADAELNAQVIEKLGFEAVRGSGGRVHGLNAGKGGAVALIALKKALDAGKNVAMIVDVQNAPREATLGAITLAKLSGRPILPVAVATSRRKVLEKTWDKTTISLPFGRCAVVVGEAIHVAPGSSDEACTEFRQELTRNLDAATAEAYAMVDAPR
jgi:lysophospholipid acyltransferase (LPLAT)-like uncharacterized protein